jgi:hypothetical protein
MVRDGYAYPRRVQLLWPAAVLRSFLLRVLTFGFFLTGRY